MKNSRLSLLIQSHSVGKQQSPQQGECIPLSPSNSLPDSGDFSSPVPANLADVNKCYIRLPDASVLQTFFHSKKSHVTHVIDVLAEECGFAKEKSMFGLCIMDPISKKRIWLPNDKLLSKLVKCERSGVYDAELKIRFYPQDPLLDIETDFSRRQFVCQLRSDFEHRILRGSNDDVYLLAAHLLHYKTLADQPVEIKKEFHFLVDRKLLKQNLDDMKQKDKKQTEYALFNIVSQLETYGMELFNLTDKQGNALVLGVGTPGINIYNKGHLFNAFQWSKIASCAFEERGPKVIIEVDIASKKLTKLALTVYDVKEEVKLCYDRIQDCMQHYKGMIGLGDGRTQVAMNHSSEPIKRRLIAGNRFPSTNGNLHHPHDQHFHERSSSLITLLRKASSQSDVDSQAQLSEAKTTLAINSLNQFLSPQKNWQYHVNELKKIVEAHPINVKSAQLDLSYLSRLVEQQAAMRKEHEAKLLVEEEKAEHDKKRLVTADYDHILNGMILGRNDSSGNDDAGGPDFSGMGGDFGGDFGMM